MCIRTKAPSSCNVESPPQDSASRGEKFANGHCLPTAVYRAEYRQRRQEPHGAFCLGSYRNFATDNEDVEDMLSVQGGQADAACIFQIGTRHFRGPVDAQIVP